MRPETRSNTVELFSGAAIRQGPQTCFGIAATDGHSADLASLFERSSRQHAGHQPQDGNDDLQVPQQQLELVVGHRGLVRLIRRWAIQDAMRG